MSALMGALDQDGPALLDRALQTRVNLPKVPTRSLPKACADRRAPVSSSAPRPMVTRPQANAVSSARSPIAHRGVLINASGLLTSHNSTGWPEPLIIPALQPHWGPGRRRQRAKRANLLGIAETKPPALRWSDNQGAHEPGAEWARRRGHDVMRRNGISCAPGPATMSRTPRQQSEMADQDFRPFDVAQQHRMAANVDHPLTPLRQFRDRSPGW